MPLERACFKNPNPKRGAKTTVVNVRTHDFDVYIGPAVLGSRHKWEQGNSVFACPFQVGIDGTPEQVVEKFRARLQKFLRKENPAWRKRMLAIKGLRLGCWCKPGPCHGDVLAQLADAMPSQ